MDYKHIEQLGQDIILTGVKHFGLANTLDCGQAFRWRSNGDNMYTGIAYGRRLDLENIECENTLIFKNVTLNEFETLWKNYFDFERSYDNLIKTLCEADSTGTIGEAITRAKGIRVLQQEPWEAMISFILSQNSNIPRIKKMIEALCESFGEQLPCGGYTFPNAKTLATLTIEKLEPIKSGYRAKYILDAARCVSDGIIDFSVLAKISSEEAQKKLLEIHGIGPKVAECILLYGMNRIERYPIDVWMKRVMAKYYPSGFPEEFSKYAGIAQQFLFHYERIVVSIKND